MSILSIDAQFPNFDGVAQAVERASRGQGLTYTREAVRAATADVVQRTWINYASGAQVTYSGGTFRINSISGAYVRSIENGIRFTENLVGEVTSNSPYGGILEDGQPARDMKPKMLASPKAKTGKDGKKYITVPFRHGSPTSVGMAPMPKSVYSQAKKLNYSRTNGKLGTRTHTWGGKLGKSGLGQRSHIAPHAGAGYTWKTGAYSGMVRMGKKGHSQYMTFRRLSENSPPEAWMFPAVKARPIRQAVVENTREEVLQLIRRGFEMDLYFMGLGDEG